MDIYIFNRNIELQGIIDNFTSLIWTRKYGKSGEFSLTTNVTDNVINLLKRDNIIYKKDDTEGAFIETVEISLNSQGKEEIKVTGKFLTSYLNRRINWTKLVKRSTYENIMRLLVSNNAINTIANRIINNLELGEFKGYTGTTKYTNSYGNVLELLENISNSSDLGFRLNLNITTKKMQFEVYEGVDRTINQSLIAPCIFSRDFENVLEQKYFDSINNYKNTSLICGVGEDEARVKTNLGDNNIGLDRYELYVDAKDLSNKETIDNVEVEISADEYIAMLQQRGSEKLGETKKVQTFSGKVNTNGNNVYKKDYDLGDIVTVLDKKWGVTIDTRITEIEEVYEVGGLQINPTFGNNIPTIIDKIKQVVK